MNNFKTVKFQNEDFVIDVKFDVADNTVWLTQKQMAELFNVSVDNISLHIKNVFPFFALRKKRCFTLI